MLLRGCQLIEWVLPIMAGSSAVVKVHFEVFGKVQGVFFRKGTQKICQQNNVCGWVKNTRQGTVVGVAEGEKESIEIVKNWLTKVGTKRSIIERCEFKDETVTDKKEFSEFTIIR